MPSANRSPLHSAQKAGNSSYGFLGIGVPDTAHTAPPASSIWSDSPPGPKTSFVRFESIDLQ